ncbi:MAG: DMT family transporter [Deferribacterales bacterium]|nr:DMT family transporter [Deferribacterales bacterium]
MGIIGQLSALGTALSWTLVGIFLGKASPRIGSFSTNFFKLLFGFLFLSITAFITRGIMFPVDANLKNWIYLIISGFVGFFIGDYFMLKAYIEVGVRISMLMMATSPPLTALLEYLLFKESISLRSFFGMVITLLGIAIVILSKDDDVDKMRVKYSFRGLMFAFIGAFGQAGGLILSKVGIEGLNILAATQIRIIGGFLSFLIFAIFTGGFLELKKSLTDKPAIGYTALGAFFGPFIGVSLSLVSLKYITAGISSTITSITPITIIPFSIKIFNEKISFKEILGAIISVFGVALLFV